VSPTVEDRLSSADAAWLHMDRPTNLMVINSVLLFDERLDWQRLADVVQRRLVDPYPRFRQRISDHRLRIGGPRWEEDRDFDIARHLHRLGLPAPGDESALKELAGDLAGAPLDREKPLWDMYLLDGPGDGSAVIVRIHHCIADGIALAGVMLSLTDPSPGEAGRPPRRAASPRRPSERRASPLRAIAGSLGSALEPAAVELARRLTRTVTSESARTLAHPRHALEIGGGLTAEAQALAKLLFTPSEGAGVFKHDLGVARKVAWSRPLSLDQVKGVAHAQGATVNDVLLAAVSGALRAYLLARGEAPHELRTMVPVNLRAPTGAEAAELGNRFGLVFLTLPVDRPARRERLRELKLRMDAIKDSPEGPVSYAVLQAVGLTPPELESRIVDVFTAKATAVMTNVPGPREGVYLAGSRLRTVLVWAPTAGSVGMSVSIFSYDGRITIGLLVHAELVPDPQAILDGLQREVAAMVRLAPATNGGRR
jgi:diacylglycerol O-acyltransferase